MGKVVVLKINSPSPSCKLISCVIHDIVTKKKGESIHQNVLTFVLEKFLSILFVTLLHGSRAPASWRLVHSSGVLFSLESTAPLPPARESWIIRYLTRLIERSPLNAILQDTFVNVVLTCEDTLQPTALPTELPSQAPSRLPSRDPTARPTDSPTPNPTQVPTDEPTEAPTVDPTLSPTHSMMLVV